MEKEKKARGVGDVGWVGDGDGEGDEKGGEVSCYSSVAFSPTTRPKWNQQPPFWQQTPREWRNWDGRKWNENRHGMQNAPSRYKQDGIHAVFPLLEHGRSATSYLESHAGLVVDHSVNDHDLAIDCGRFGRHLGGCVGAGIRTLQMSVSETGLSNMESQALSGHSSSGRDDLHEP